MILKVTFAVWNLSNSRIVGNTVCHLRHVHVKPKAGVACSFNHLFKNEGLLKVTASHVYTVMLYYLRKRSQILSLLLQTTNMKWYMAYRIKAFPVTLSDLQGHPTAGLFNGDFSNSCAAVDKITTDIVRCAVSLQ